jgi:hypothetical protein
MGLNEQRTFIYTSGAWTVGTVESHGHAGLGPTFASSAFQVTEAASGNSTNRLAFSLSGITAGTTRTLTVPNASGTIALTSDFAAPPAIGTTTPAAGTFTTLAANTSLTLNGTGAAELINAGAAAGDFRIYNTHTSATNYERGFMRWSSNAFRIGTEKGSGGGTARALELSVNGNRRIYITDSGQVGIGSTTGALASHGLFVDVPASNSTLTSGSVTIRGSTAVTLDNGGDPILRVQSSRVMFGGTTSLFPALKRSSTALQVRLADDTAFAPLECAGLTLNGDLTASTRNIVTDTTTGTKIGTSTTQKIGFFNATPAVQPSAVADATDAASTQARLNDLLARLRTLGLIAT